MTRPNARLTPHEIQSHPSFIIGRTKKNNRAPTKARSGLLTLVTVMDMAPNTETLRAPLIATPRVLERAMAKDTIAATATPTPPAPPNAEVPAKPKTNAETINRFRAPGIAKATAKITAPTPAPSDASNSVTFPTLAFATIMDEAAANIMTSTPVIPIVKI